MEMEEKVPLNITPYYTTSIQYSTMRYDKRAEKIPVVRAAGIFRTLLG